MRNYRGSKITVRFCGLAIAFALIASRISKAAEIPQASRPQPSAPRTLTLQDAMKLAQANEPQFLSALTDARVAHEDVRQARVAIRPTWGLRSEYLGTQGDGVLPSGRYVTNDGVHVYREWSVVHQDLSPGTLMRTGYK